MAPPVDLRRGARGHTLLELTLVAVLLSILGVLVMRGSKPMVASALALRDRSLSTNELRLAIESILDDLGDADDAEKQGNKLRIERSEEYLSALGLWSGSKDDGVEYDRSGTDLVREDLQADTEVVVARDVTRFNVRKVGSTLRVLIGTGSGSGERTLTLYWTY